VAALSVVAIVAAACGGHPAASTTSTPTSNPGPPSAPTSNPRPPSTPTSGAATSSSSTSTSTSTTTTTVPVGAAPYDWATDHGVALDLGGGSTSTLSAIVAPGASGEWLIAGTRSSRSGPTTATVWTSSDGLHWSRFALPRPGPGIPTTARAATNWLSRQVVVGSVGTGPDMSAAVWVSQGPGQPFLLLAQSPTFLPPANVPAGGQDDGTLMDAVGAGALGLFVAGTIDGRTTMWYSTGGQRWQLLGGADGAINRYPDAVVNDILSTPSGIFVGGTYLDGNRLSGQLWSSSDGIHWTGDGGWFAGAGDRVVTSVVDMSEAGNAEPGTPGPTGMLVVGGIRVGATWQPASWISPTGNSWSQTSNSFLLDGEPSGSPGALVYAAAGADGRLLAVGGSPGRQRLWQSANGLAWSAVGLPAGAAGASGWHLGLVAASGHTIVAADNVPGQPYVLINDGSQWHQPSAPGIFGRPLPTAVPTSLVHVDGTLTMSVQISRPGPTPGSGTTSVAVLTSSDGKSWHTATTHAFGRATVNQLYAVPEGLLAVGSTPLARPAGEGGPGSTGAFARLSADGGMTWPDELISPATIGGPEPDELDEGDTGETITGEAGPGAVDLSAAPTTAAPTTAAPTTASPTTASPTTATSTTASPTTPAPTTAAPTTAALPRPAAPTTTAPFPATGKAKSASVKAASKTATTTATTGVPSATTATTTGPGGTGPAATTTTTEALGPAPYTFSPLAAITAGRVGDSQYVVGVAGTEAVDWFSPDGNTWEAPRDLDTSPQLGTEQPTASCTAGTSAVVVGSVGTTSPGSLPVAWTSTDGSSWTPGIFTPTPPAGSFTTVDGCLPTGNGFLAYGQTGNGVFERPVLWYSPDGINWQQTAATFASLGDGESLGASAAPLDDIVPGTSTLLGLSGQGDLPSQVWPAPVGGSAGAEPTPAGLWSSVDAGSNWQQVVTDLPAFTGTLFAQVDVAAFVGQQPIVAGTVDGRLRVWVGTPAPTSTTT
jgi:hypothetical protein